ARAAVGLGPSFGDAPAATVGARLGAYLVDAAAVSVVGVATLLLTGRPALAGLLAAEVVVGLVVWEARTGRTLGNLALGLRAARVESPYALGAGRAGLRALVLAAGHLVAGLGQWVVVGSVAADSSPRRQGWHDRAGRAVVVDVRRMPEHAAADPAAPHGSVQQTAPPRPRPASASPAGTAAPAVPQPTAPAPRPVPSRYLLTLDTGDVWTVHGQGLVGRAPQVREGERHDHLIAIEDPERSLSRTHAVFGVARTGFWVRDAGSGNGTVLVLPSGQAVTVTAEQAVTVPSGSTVRIGGRAFTVQEVPPA
ncbi:FHA domain-containing protein, partial [Cellulomonas fimi]